MSKKKRPTKTRKAKRAGKRKTTKKTKRKDPRKSPKKRGKPSGLLRHFPKGRKANPGKPEVLRVVHSADPKKAAEAFRNMLALERGYSSKIRKQGRKGYIVVASDNRAIVFAPTEMAKWTGGTPKIGNPRGKVASGKTYRPKIKLSATARKFLRAKIVLLMREGKKQKQAIAIAFAAARKKGFKIPAIKNPLLGVTTLLGHIPGLVSASNPGKPKRKRKTKRKAKKSRAGKKSRGGGRSARHGCKGKNKCAAPKRKRRGKKPNPSTRTVRYLDMNAADRKRYRKDALMAAKFAGATLRDVVFDDVPTPHGFKNDDSFVEVGEEVAVEYRVRGKASARHGYTWRHRAGDNGKGKKKTKPPIIAIHRKSGQQVTVSQPGTRRTFSPDEGLKG